MKKDNMIENPSHYNFGCFEVIDVIDDWELNFNLGNAIKYIGRCKHKGNKVQDLQKAIFYLEREIRWTENNGDEDSILLRENKSLKEICKLQEEEIENLNERIQELYEE